MRRQNIVTGHLMTLPVGVGTLNHRPISRQRGCHKKKNKSNCQSKKKEEKDKSGHGPQTEARYQDELVDCLSASRRTPETPLCQYSWQGLQLNITYSRVANGCSSIRVHAHYRVVFSFKG
jgi:hypothetical protein